MRSGLGGAAGGCVGVRFASLVRTAGEAQAASSADAHAIEKPRRVRRGEDGFNGISSGAPGSAHIDAPD